MTRRQYIHGPDLRRARRMSELSQADIAAALGVSRTRITIAEGSTRVTPSLAARYFEALERLSREPDE